ncbi:MAG: hypothetical protein ABFD89_06695 [Bryobacteraceae bacterium]
MAVILAVMLLAVSSKAQPNATGDLANIKQFVPAHPWRAIDGHTNSIKVIGVEFVGRIVDVGEDGVIINGVYGPLGQISYSSSAVTYPDFFVANFPFEVETDHIINLDNHLMAVDTGHTYTYTTIRGSVRGASRTIHKLDYGIPCGPPPALMQAQAAAAKAESDRLKRSAGQAKTNAFHWLQAQSTNNDNAGAQYRLAICYLTGAGCATNRIEAMKWLKLSASSGNLEASNKLATLRP